MACPVVPVLAVGAVAGGTHTIFIQDRQHRVFAWSALLALLAGWSLYALALRAVPFRIVLEAATMLAFSAAIARAWWLARHGGVRSPVWPWLARATRHLVAVFADPFVLSAQVWLLAMVTMQWRGKAHFGVAEYAAVSGALVLLAAVRVYRLMRMSHARRSRFAALESFAPNASCESCPLGFGGRDEHDGAR